MNVIELLVRSAQQNHGRQLQPEQIQELLQELANYNRHLETVQSRLDALTRLSTVLLLRLGGKAVIEATEFHEADEAGGFTVNWDGEGDIIYVEFVPDVEVPEVSDDAEATSDGDGDESQMSLDFEGAGLEAGTEE